MGFWDFLTDPEEISGTPHATRKYVGRRPNYGGAINQAANYLKDAALNGSPIRRSPVHKEDGIANRRIQRLRDQALAGLQEATGPPSTADILSHLEQLQDPSRYMGDTGSLAEQALAMSSAQYDPIIAQLEAQMGSARSRAGRSKQELGQMFNALSTDLQGDIPEIQQMYAGDKAEAKQSYDQLGQQIKDQYAQSGAEQEAMMQRLNIQAAAPDILPEQQRDRDYFTQLASRDSAVEQNALGREESGAINFTRQGSEIARTEGTQRQADVMAQLSDLLNEYSGQIGAQKAAKQTAYASNLLDLQGKQQTSASEAAQRDFENYISMIQIGRALKKDDSGTGAVTSVKSPADVAGRAMGMGLDQNGSQRVQDIFMSTISSDPQILSGAGVFGQSMPKEAMAQRVVAAGRRNGLSPSELNALQTIALEYFGRR